jgi:hypothetical protein
MPSFAGSDPTYRDEVIPLMGESLRATKGPSSGKRWHDFKAAIAVPCFGLVTGLASLGDHSAVTDRIMVTVGGGVSSQASERVNIQARAPSVFNEDAMEIAWQSAMQLLEGSGTTVADFLRVGAENVQTYKSDKLQFPASFPKDEC